MLQEGNALAGVQVSLRALKVAQRKSVSLGVVVEGFGKRGTVTLAKAV